MGLYQFTLCYENKNTELYERGINALACFDVFCYVISTTSSIAHILLLCGGQSVTITCHGIDGRAVCQ